MDFSDNELKDSAGIHILNMIKFQAERRDLEMWSEGLRNKKKKQSSLEKSRASGSGNILNLMIEQNSYPTDSQIGTGRKLSTI